MPGILAAAGWRWLRERCFRRWQGLRKAIGVSWAWWCRRVGRGALGLTAALLSAALIAACGGEIASPDLFVVQRTGVVAGARLTLLVNDGGFVRCNGGPQLALSDPLLIEARAIQEEIHDAAARHVTLAAGPNSVLGYQLRDQDGTVRFSDNSPGQPHLFHQIAAFVLHVARGTCHLQL